MHCLQKTLSLRTFPQCADILFALKVWERLRRDKRDLNIEVCKRLGRLTKKLFFTQTIADETYKRMLRNQAKLDRIRRLWILFLLIYDH